MADSSARMPLTNKTFASRDFPGHISATVFLGGCNFRCPFCHNADLVRAPESLETIPVDFFLAFSPERVDPGNDRFSTRTIPKVVGGTNAASTALARDLQSLGTRTLTVGRELTKQFEEVAFMDAQDVTAWLAAEDCITLDPGEKVLVHAAAGGVGLLLVQLARRRGCEIFATAGSDAKLDLLREEFGVKHAINYRAQDFRAEVRRVCGARAPIDVVFDSIGGGVFHRSRQLLAPGGRLVYATCSLSRRENEDVVGAFLAANPAFAAVPPAPESRLRPDHLWLGEESMLFPLA